MYPGLARSLKNQTTEQEWKLIKENIENVEKAHWNNAVASKLLEETARSLVERGLFQCAAKVLYYYDRFYVTTV